MACTLQLHCSPPLVHRPKLRSLSVHQIQNKFFSLSKSAFRTGRAHCFSGDRDEQRWLREEERWLREERRWLREEARWNAERQALKLEIESLQLRIETLNQQRVSQEASIADLISSLTALLQTLKEMNIKSLSRSGLVAGKAGVVAGKTEAETGIGDLVVGKDEVEEMKETVYEEIRALKGEVEIRASKKERRLLRKGAEGEDVRDMQEALQRLGFYSGEEDMEYSSFSSGTERAVKTWQATLGSNEDGIMTVELLEMLFSNQELMETGEQENLDRTGRQGSSTWEEADVNGVPQASAGTVKQVAEIKQTVVTETDVGDVEISEHRVFLLGENRWEEPSRLTARSEKLGVGKGNKASALIKCLTCRGDGRLMCTECDGTGEPNIEPQFMEWVDEGAKCPYCEGLGYTVCDTCDGRKLIQP
ncbi:hypothetical protein AMTRI_Chr07g24470 [Amborella trichopoda]|uniref:Peptidoglycan binding-like domain-containing protein n=1 Tax=Amborella trichopoda TaxID=13333 RepID=U5CZN3_AMBTC|nr:uncharacterized protein LOC18447196 [Amborella trichopoda]ERN18826.1 hypothetical protein AMTR_s00067p00113950 [Amborella trichopoda]|eukprot:XP_006857359.1 uncharacterized protein LOC18447196 [Amborella trichopoda]